MGESIIVAIISGGLALIGSILSSKATENNLLHEQREQNAVQNERIANLTAEVKKHNEFAVKIPILQGDIKLLEERLKVANNRIADLEAKTNS